MRERELHCHRSLMESEAPATPDSPALFFSPPAIFSSLHQAIAGAAPLHQSSRAVMLLWQCKVSLSKLPRPRVHDRSEMAIGWIRPMPEQVQGSFPAIRSAWPDHRTRP